MKIKQIIASSLLSVLMLGTSIAMQAQSLSPSTKWHWNKGTIVTEVPERPAG